MQFLVNFTCEAYWEGNNLIIECPSPAARDFVIREIEDKPILLKLRKPQEELREIEHRPAE